ncbi:hypothetical protein [Demequina aurantiaca]|uniref:hypothetical protein n=1 Tax=Demequina aurantiaca TaxID=676200 RepID=UPI003D3264DF
MSLRTTGLIAGVIGVILLIVGFVADSVRPPEDVVAHADVDTAVVVYQPDFLTISPEGDLSVQGEGGIVAYTARPVDAEAWLATVDYTEVTSLPDWQVLGTRDVTVPAPTPSPAPSGSASASASPSPSETAEPSASPSPSVSPSPVAVPTETDPFVSAEGRTTDIWREGFTGTDTLSIAIASVPAGQTLVVMSTDGAALTGTDVSLTRVVNDDWITPLLWWGAILVLAGLVALVVLFIDLRPAQSRGESWMASRKSGNKDDAESGSRRSRRAAGAVIPTASLDDAPAITDGASEADDSTGSVPADEAAYVSTVDEETPADDAEDADSADDAGSPDAYEPTEDEPADHSDSEGTEDRS